MKVELQGNFLRKLNRQVAYIAWDKPQAARRFKNELLERIRQLGKHPYAHRKSIYFDDELIRDLIFGSYCIVYQINKVRNRIIVFGFVRNELKP